MISGERRPNRANVIGRGPAALAVSIALAQRGWTVTLRARPNRPSGPSRIDVLGGAALTTLARLGISRDDMLAVARPCPGVWSHWSPDGVSGIDFIATPGGPAWAVDRADFEGLLGKRAVEEGVVFADGEHTHRHDQRWQILASGCLATPSGPWSPREYDDRLIALVGIGKMSASEVPVDRRLMIEAGRDGWAYGIAGPKDRACFGVITDALSLAGQRPPLFASGILARTERIARLLERLHDAPVIRAVPVPCRWLPLRAGPRSVRIGDAHASFDPLAGRGLWEAVQRAEQVAVALDKDPARLENIERSSEKAYQSYLAERASYYHDGRIRFGTGFWVRRCLSASAQRKQQTT